MTNQTIVKPKKSIYVVLWCLCIIGAWSVLPYISYMGIVPASISLTQLFLVTTVNSALIYAVICSLCYFIVPKSGLRPFVFSRPISRIVMPGVIAGFLAGFIIYALDSVFFKSSLLSGVHPPVWTGLLASFYGGINEEVLLRLFLFTLVCLLLGKIFRSKNGLILLWVTNIIVALIFGLGHLPAAFKLMDPTGFEIFRILLLNGIPGIIFGYLYWTRGLWACCLAHFTTDIIIHGLLV